MSDPISVRQVMASTDITERVTKAEAATNQSLGEEFAKELSRQNDLKQTRVIEKDQSDKVEVRDQSQKRDQEQKKKDKEKAEAEAEELKAEVAAQSSHIIDLQV